MSGDTTAFRNSHWITVIKFVSAGMIIILCLLFPSTGMGKWIPVFGDRVLGSENSPAGDTVWKEHNGYCYCVKRGKKLKGLKTEGGKTYYFDSRGRQKTGWRKVSNRYCYFTIKNGAEGCLVKGKTVNGITIDKTGTAQATANTKAKLSLLIRYQQLADRLVKPAADEKEKLIRVFLYARKSRRGVTPEPGYSGRWDEKMAASFLNLGYGDCLGKAAAFAYLANALGYKKVTLVRNGHAFVTFGKRIYEVSLAVPKAGMSDLVYFGRKYTAKIVSWHAAQVRKKMPHRVI